MSAQLSPAASHCRHWYVKVGAGALVHVPALAKSDNPTFGVPEIDGATVFTGAVGTAAIITFGDPTSETIVADTAR